MTNEPATILVVDDLVQNVRLLQAVGHGDILPFGSSY